MLLTSRFSNSYSIIVPILSQIGSEYCQWASRHQINFKKWERERVGGDLLWFEILNNDKKSFSYLDQIFGKGRITTWVNILWNNKLRIAKQKLTSWQLAPSFTLWSGTMANHSPNQSFRGLWEKLLWFEMAKTAGTFIPHHMLISMSWRIRSFEKLQVKHNFQNTL